MYVNCVAQGLMHRIMRAPSTSLYTGTSAVRVTAGTSGSVPQQSITRRRYRSPTDHFHIEHLQINVLVGLATHL